MSSPFPSSENQPLDHSPMNVPSLLRIALPLIHSTLRAPSRITLLGLAVVTLLGPTVAAQNNSTVALVRHGLVLNGRLEGSCQQLTGEAAVFNSNATMLGEFLVPGTPTIQVNGNVTWGRKVTGSGSASPSGYTITLNSGAHLGHIVIRTDPVAMHAVPAPTEHWSPTPAAGKDLSLAFPARVNRPLTICRD